MSGLRRAGTGWAFIGPSTLVILGLSIFPAGWAWILSQQRWNGFSKPRNIGWRNYQAMLDDESLRAAVLHTAFYTALFVPASVLAGLFIAIALNRQIRFIGFYRTCVFVPFVASSTAIGILANYIFDPQFGFANTVIRSLGLPVQKFLEDPRQAMLVIAAMTLWSGLGFTVVVYLAALQDIQKDLIEAAVVDGASKLQVFRFVVWPELTPVTVFTGIWQLIGALQLFDVVYTTTRGGPLDATQTIVYFLWDQAFIQLRFGYGSAVAYGLFALTLVITLMMVVYSRFAKVRAF
ncbi:MAG: sugar ABC transporter permease [Kineosporiaceae bacterium]|nr:sugar ABC transporter permease [Kineosporiaceae bacterium]MBK7625464.1 sugar ABC transporter permease [Kineosporiaceae bacterium]MBK8076173.1 sugar ABC transporter permease [Kineosporiaceae bacterium]